MYVLLWKETQSHARPPRPTELRQFHVTRPRRSPPVMCPCCAVAPLLLVMQLGEVDATSLLYETPPMYVEDQPWFLNAACRLSTDLGPAVLLDHLKALEAAVGR